MTDNQKNVLEYLAENRYACLLDVVDNCKLSMAGVKKIITKLKEEGYLVREGTLKNPEWIVK